MSVIEKFSTISNTVTKLIEFVCEDSMIKEDYQDYLTTISSQNLTQSQIQSMMIPYIFERRLTDDNKSIIDLYLEKNTKVSSFEKNMLEALAKSYSSIFQINRVLQNGFELISLINEKTYKVLSLVKMTNYRGVYRGQYALARIFNFENEFYLLEMPNVLSESKKEEVQKFAIAKIIEKPEDVYIDNPEKLKEIEKQVAVFSNKFLECFGTDEIVTTNQYADNLINIFNNYSENEVKAEADEISKNIKPIEKYEFFHVPDFDSSYSNFVEKSMGGFASHKATYDVALIYDKDLGLFAIPFFATLKRIYEVDDYKTISGYEACVKGFMENDKIPHQLIKRIADKFPEFTNRTNEILGTSYTYDALISKYKSDSLAYKIFSPTSVLYSSKVFSDMMGFVIEESIVQEPPKFAPVGRNEPCPCGSGKKYKKCCMLKQ